MQGGFCIRRNVPLWIHFFPAFLSKHFFMLYIYFSPVFVLSLWNKYLIGCFSARVHMLFTGFSKLKIWAEYKFQFCHDCNIAKCTKTITTNVVKTKIDATKITALQRKHCLFDEQKSLETANFPLGIFLEFLQLQGEMCLPSYKNTKLFLKLDIIIFFYYIILKLN